MRKLLPFLLICIVFSNSNGLFAHDQSVIDPDLFQSIRDQYDGTWSYGGMGGTVGAEILKDGSMLIEIKDRLAEFFFYNIPQATENILYVPFDPLNAFTQPFFNYFERSSSALVCGFTSLDLKKDPWRMFTCRYRVSPSGELTAFLDRTEETSNADMMPGPFQGSRMDFYWEMLDQITGEGLTNNFRNGTPSEYSFLSYVEGNVAEVLYSLLDLPENEEMIPTWGSEYIVEKTKKNGQIVCSRTSEPIAGNETPSEGHQFKASCTFNFGFDGMPLPDQDSWNG